MGKRTSYSFFKVVYRVSTCARYAARGYGRRLGRLVGDFAALVTTTTVPVEGIDRVASRSRVSGDAGCARGVGEVVGGARGSGEGLHELEGTALGERPFLPALPIGNLRRLRRGDGDGVGLDVPVHVPGGEPHDGARQRDVERLVQSPRTAHAEVEARGTGKINNDAST